MPGTVRGGQLKRRLLIVIDIEYNNARHVAGTRGRLMSRKKEGKLFRASEILLPMLVFHMAPAPRGHWHGPRQTVLLKRRFRSPLTVSPLVGSGARLSGPLPAEQFQDTLSPGWSADLTPLV